MTEIEAKNLTHKFGDQSLLNNLNLKIEKGDKWVIIGPSGQGKSTLLKILAGIINPLEGIVKVKGRELSSLQGVDRESLQKKMGFLFQKNALFDSLTVFENVAFPLREKTQLTEQEITERVQFYLEAVGLSSAQDLFPDEISGGMQKRLGIARALALEPEVVFYDDPTAGLDPITSRKIVDLILDLQKKKNATVVAITNDMNRAYQLADQILFVSRDQCLLTGTVEQTQNYRDPRVQQFIKGSRTGPLTGTT